MKKILLSMLAVAGAFSAYSAEISDYCGEYQANFISAFGNPEITMFKITQSETEGKVILDGLYAPPSIGSSTLEADIDVEAGTLTIPFTDMSYYDEGLEFFGIVMTDQGLDFTKDPVVGHLKEEGVISFDDIYGFAFGHFDDEMVYASMCDVTFSPKKDLIFKYNEDEWTHIGTAQYPDLCFGYKIFDTRDPVMSTVDVVMNNKNPKRIALLNPYQTTEWKSYNRDKEAVGQIVIDLTDPDVVVFEPYVYSGFNYNWGGTNLGKTYVYNTEGFYVKVAGMSTDEARDIILDYGQPISTFDGQCIFIGWGSMIFGTEKNPTTQYSWGDNEGVIEFDDDAIDAIDKGSVGICLVETPVDVPVEFYDLMGNKVDKPVRGGIYICRKGERATKLMF